MESVLVANPDETKGRPGPKPDPVRVRAAVTNIRSMPDWKERLEELKEFDRASSLGELIDRAIVAYAREVGFPKPFPKR